MRQKGTDGVGGYHRDECPALIDEGCNCCDRDCVSFSSGVEGLGDINIIRTDGATEWRYVF
jgi:hypothetical protein